MDDQLKSLTDTLVKNITNNFLGTLQSTVTRQVLDEIAVKLSQIDITAIVESQVDRTLKGMVENMSFPDNSIPASALQTQDIRIPAGNVSGGMIKEFESTGIQDRATWCQVTILDQATVFENKLVAAELEIAGDAIINGKLILNGTVPDDSPLLKDLIDRTTVDVRSRLDRELFARYADAVFLRIKNDGITVDRLEVANKPLIVAGNSLGPTITKSNLQELGELSNLTVNGVSLLSGVLYTNNKRVGINTTDPVAPLTIWDEEVELAFSKRRRDTALIGTLRPQSVVLSSSGKENIVLMPDGSVKVENIIVGRSLLGSTADTPNFDAPRGTVLFNDNPDFGQFTGWISLGGARWSGFGRIE